MCVITSNCCRFQYILNAATSPATRMSEETLTYLNQGIIHCERRI